MEHACRDRPADISGCGVDASGSPNPASRIVTSADVELCEPGPKWQNCDATPVPRTAADVLNPNSCTLHHASAFNLRASKRVIVPPVCRLQSQQGRIITGHNATVVSRLQSLHMCIRRTGSSSPGQHAAHAACCIEQAAHATYKSYSFLSRRSWCRLCRTHVCALGN